MLLCSRLLKGCCKYQEGTEVFPLAFWRSKLNLVFSVEKGSTSYFIQYNRSEDKDDATGAESAKRDRGGGGALVCCLPWPSKL